MRALTVSKMADDYLTTDVFYHVHREYSDFFYSNCSQNAIFSNEMFSGSKCDPKGTLESLFYEIEKSTKFRFKLTNFRNESLVWEALKFGAIDFMGPDMMYADHRTRLFDFQSMDDYIPYALFYVKNVGNEQIITLGSMLKWRWFIPLVVTGFLIVATAFGGQRLPNLKRLVCWKVFRFLACVVLGISLSFLLSIYSNFVAIRSYSDAHDKVFIKDLKSVQDAILNKGLELHQSNISRWDEHVVLNALSVGLDEETRKILKSKIKFDIQTDLFEALRVNKNQNFLTITLYEKTNLPGWTEFCSRYGALDISEILPSHVYGFYFTRNSSNPKLLDEFKNYVSSVGLKLNAVYNRIIQDRLQKDPSRLKCNIEPVKLFEPFSLAAIWQNSFQYYCGLILFSLFVGAVEVLCSKYWTD